MLSAVCRRPPSAVGASVDDLLARLPPPRRRPGVAGDTARRRERVTPPSGALAANALLQRLATEPWQSPAASEGCPAGADAPDWEARVESARLWMMAAPSVEVEGTYNSALDAVVHRACVTA